MVAHARRGVPVAALPPLDVGEVVLVGGRGLLRVVVGDAAWHVVTLVRLDPET